VPAARARHAFAVPPRSAGTLEEMQAPGMTQLAGFTRMDGSFLPPPTGAAPFRAPIFATPSPATAPFPPPGHRIPFPPPGQHIDHAETAPNLSPNHQNVQSPRHERPAATVLSPRCANLQLEEPPAKRQRAKQAAQERRLAGLFGACFLVPGGEDGDSSFHFVRGPDQREGADWERADWPQLHLWFNDAYGCSLSHTDFWTAVMQATQRSDANHKTDTTISKMARQTFRKKLVIISNADRAALAAAAATFRAPHGCVLCTWLCGIHCVPRRGATVLLGHAARQGRARQRQQQR
jgi:hypothetical protein